MISCSTERWKWAIMLPVTMVMIVMLVGCGDYKTIKGSEKSGVANIFVTITPEDRTVATHDIDVVQDVCSGATAAITVFEPFTDATASVSLSYEPTAGCLNGTQTCPYIYLESFDVSFSSTDPSAVAIPTWSYYIIQKIGEGAAGTVDVAMLPIQLKEQYITNGGNPALEVNYGVTFTFHGKTEFGDKIEAQGTTYILLSDWDNCPGG